jgi:F-type H+-transporting ATPase subunit epsilon
MIRLLFLTPQKVLFDGECESIIVPGEAGFFEILPYHQNLLSRILPGVITLNNTDSFSIKRGIIKMERNTAMIVAELAG